MMEATIKRVRVLFAEAAIILREEGLIPLLRHSFTFLADHLFQYRTYWLLEYPTRRINGLDEADFMPRIDEFTFRIVFTNREADELEADGLDFRSWSSNCTERLDKGAVASCVFAGRELAHILWVATTEEAKRTFNDPPYRVDFSNKEYCLGGSWTNPKYRRKGLAKYAMFKTKQSLQEKGMTRDRGAISKNNVVSQTAYSGFSPKWYAEGRYLKLLWWESWKEKPVDSKESTLGLI